MTEPKHILKSFAGVDVRETVILNYDRNVLETLLIDYTTEKNILWGTDDYKEDEEDTAVHACNAPITIELITGKYVGSFKTQCALKIWPSVLHPGLFDNMDMEQYTKPIIKDNDLF